MKIVRYLDRENKACFGALADSGAVHPIIGDIFNEYRASSEVIAPRKLLAPLPVTPPAIYCIGLNYRRHAAESGAKVPQHPIVFMKGPNTVQNPNDPILLPRRLRSDMVDYECELAIVLSRTCRNVSRTTALNYVLGYTCANDVSARDWQKEKGGSQWCRAKSFDTFCPLGPCLVTPATIANPNRLQIKTIVNNEVLQDWNTDDMIFDVPALIEFLSGSTTLYPGTVILTGTPHGVGMARIPPRWLQAGDSVTVEIEKIGRLTNPVDVERG